MSQVIYLQISEKSKNEWAFWHRIMPMTSIKPIHMSEIIAPSKQSSQGHFQTCGAPLNHIIGNRNNITRRILILNFPIDGRWGIERICNFLKNTTTPKIDLEAQNDSVVVVNRSRKVAKVISVYNSHYEIRVYILKQGRYQHLVAFPDEGDFREVSEKQLERYLKGYKLDIKRYSPKCMNFKD